MKAPKERLWCGHSISKKRAKTSDESVTQITKKLKYSYYTEKLKYWIFLI